ncbi:hypothetical protein CBS13152_11168 [Aspergillus niger]|nr:hypothetical protein CBS13152_11168 [Aspergillus niger]
MKTGQPLAKSTSGVTTSTSVVFGSGTSSLTQANVHGCTVLYAVSKYAVYEAHLWESPGFVSSQNGTVAFNEQAFQTNIISYLTNDANLKLPQLTGSAAYPDPGTQIYIGTPVAATGQGAKYASQISRIASTVNQVLGLSAEPAEYYYTTTSTDGENNWLFQYNENTCNKPVWQIWYGGVADNALWSASQTSSSCASSAATPSRTPGYPAYTPSTMMVMPKATPAY